MISRVIFAIAVAFGSMLTAAVAEPIVVNSGAHDGFSRLVVQFESSVPVWSMGKTEDGYNIHIDQPGLLLDLDNIYRRIQRNHISDALYDAETQILRLETDCLCHGTAFVFRNRKLVIDISLGPAPENSEFEQIFTLPLNSSTPPSGNRRPEGEVSGHAASVAGLPPISAHADGSGYPAFSPSGIRPTGVLDLPLISERDSDKTALPQLVLRLPSRTGPDNPLAETSDHLTPLPLVLENASGATQMHDAERLLLQQVSRAASQGLLEPELRRIPETHTDKEQPLQPTAADREPRKPAAPPPVATEQINIHAETSIDRSLSTDLIGTHATGNEQLCEIGNKFDIGVWGEADDIVNSITINRSAILDATDRIDHEAVGALVRSYLYAGFAAEAVQLLTLFPDHDAETGKEREIYAQIAQLLDHPDTSGTGPAHGLQNCANAGAMWALLAMDSVPLQNVNHQAVLATASSLPPHLRGRLGSRLIRIYQSAGFDGYARTIRDAILRPGKQESDEFRIAEALRHSELKENALADATLLDVVQQNSLNSVEALEIYLNNQLDNKMPIDSSILGNAEALAFEHAGSETGLRLKILLSRTYARAGRFKDAVRELLRLDNETETDHTMPVWSELAGQLGQLPDSNFVIEIYGIRRELTEAPLDRTTRRELASRLVQQGFPEFAKTIMLASPQPETEDQVILAAAALETGNFQGTLELTSQLEDPAAYAVRQAALLRLGAYAQGAREAGEMSDVTAESTFNWRSGNWAGLSEFSNDPEVRAAAIIMLRQDSIADVPAPVGLPPNSRHNLSHSKEILERSIAERESIKALLGRFELP